jgi:hypothetical protein
MTDRHVSSGKTDELSPVQRIYHAISAEPDAGRLVVKLATAGLESSRVGIVYQEVSGNEYSDWKVAEGYFSGEAEDGRSTYTIEAPFEFYHGSISYCRYAAFVDTGSGDSQKTHWDNNNGEDFYYFNTYTKEALVSNHYGIEMHHVTISLRTIDFGHEQVYVEYSTDNWATSSETVANWTDSEGWDDAYTVEIPHDIDVTELSYKVRIEFGDNGIVRANNSGFGYAIGLKETDPTIITFNKSGFNVNGTLTKGGYFKVIYDREPLCTASYRGQTTRAIEMGYRYYDSPYFGNVVMQQLAGDPNDYRCQEEWCPENLETYPIYIPLNAQKVSLWFKHFARQSSCTHWDSNKGANYNFELN